MAKTPSKKRRAPEHKTTTTKDPPHAKPEVAKTTTDTVVDGTKKKKKKKKEEVMVDITPEGDNEVEATAAPSLLAPTDDDDDDDDVATEKDFKEEEEEFMPKPSKRRRRVVDAVVGAPSQAAVDPPPPLPRWTWAENYEHVMAIQRTTPETLHVSLEALTNLVEALCRNSADEFEKGLKRMFDSRTVGLLCQAFVASLALSKILNTAEYTKTVVERGALKTSLMSVGAELEKRSTGGAVDTNAILEALVGAGGSTSLAALIRSQQRCVADFVLCICETMKRLNNTFRML